jgi:hypothetical protein
VAVQAASARLCASVGTLRANGAHPSYGHTGRQDGKGLSTNYVTIREGIRRVGYAQVTKNRYLYATAFKRVVWAIPGLRAGYGREEGIKKAKNSITLFVDSP